MFVKGRNSSAKYLGPPKEISSPVKRVKLVIHLVVRPRIYVCSQDVDLAYPKIRKVFAGGDILRLGYNGTWGPERRGYLDGSKLILRLTNNMMKKTRTSPASDAVSAKMHTSTSEVVKTRSRKRRAPSSSPVRSSPPPETPPTENDVKPQIYQPMALVHLDELVKIWDADKRTPSVPSRRAWALARNLKPEHVHQWWYRRKKVAKKARITIPKGTYELPVGTPPIIERVVKEEPDMPESPRKVPRVSKRTSDAKDGSDPVSTVIDSTDPSSDGFGLSPSSDTAVATPCCKTLTFDQEHDAYSPPRPLQTLFLDSQMSYKHSKSPGRALFSSPLPPSSPPVFVSPEPCTSRPPASGTADKTTSSTRPSSHIICNQDANELSCFTCPLCTGPATSSDSAPTQPSDSTTHTWDYPIHYFPPAHSEHSAPTITTLSGSMELSTIFSLSRSTSLVSTSSPRLSIHVYSDSIWCFGGNNYSYDGFFLGNCTCQQENLEDRGGGLAES